MRAWLLLLAVLATFKPIVQVASTEETASTTFIKAITLQKEDFYNVVKQSDFEIELSRTSTTTTTTTTPPKTSATIQQAKFSTNTSSKSTALVKAFNLKNSNVNMNMNDMSTSTKLAEKSTKTIKEKFSKFTENSDNEVLTNDRLLTTLTTVSMEDLAPHTNMQKHIHKHHHHHHHNHQQHSNEHYKNHQNQSQQRQDSTIESTTESSTTRTTTTTTTSKSSESNANLADSTSNISIQNSDINSPALAITTTLSSSSNSSKSKSTSTSTSASTTSSTVDGVIVNEEPATYSNKEIIKEKAKPDPEVLVEIENSLLSLFNMKRPPKIDRSKIIIPEAMKKLYEEIMNQELISVNLPKPGLMTKSANTVRSFTHQDSKIDHRFPHHHRFRLYFDVKSIPAKEKLKAAEVQLSRDAISHAILKPEHANRTAYQVLAYDITRLGIRGEREPNYLLLDNKYVRLNSTESISIDVQPAVERWLHAPKQNFGLLIEVRTMRSLRPAPHHHVRLRRSVDEPHEEWQQKQPLLFTYTDDGRHKSRSIRDVNARSKRAEHHQHRRGRRRKTNEDCRRHSLYVDFADVGWSDWIVAPPGYDAYYCHGKCPFGLFEHLNTTNHAVVQTLVNNLNPAKVPKPCCVPTELEGMSMLYLNDQNSVVLKSYQDMTVVGCGCR